MRRKDWAGGSVGWGLCLLLAALLNSSWAGVEQAPGWPRASEESSKGYKPLESAKGADVNWKDEDQKKSCERKAREIREHFLRARDFSIQGDSCSSEEEARSFGEKLQELKKLCPSGFAEQSGFTPKVVKNVRTLESLGKKRCGKPQSLKDPKAGP